MTEAAARQKQQIFVRESTGLVKNVSFLDSITLNIANMSAGALLGVLGIYFVALPTVSGVNLVYASLIGFGLSIPQIILYTTMSRRFPRTGGDYVYISRTFGGFWGSTLSFMGYTLETTAYLALIVLSTVFAIGSVGLSLGNGNFFGIAVPSSVPGANPAAQLVIGVVLFAAVIGLNVLKPRWGFKLVTVLVLAGIATTLLAMGVLLSAGNAGVVNFVNSLSPKDFTYQSIASSYKGPTFDLAATIFIMPMIFAFVYPWINAGPAVASEIKGRAALRWNVPISAVAVFFLLTSALATFYFVGGLPFVNAALANPQLVFDFSFNFWTLAMGVTNNTVLSAIIGLGWIVWNVGIFSYGVIVISRYLLAQSFDRFLPAKISYVSPRFGSPVVAHSIDLILTIALIGLAAYFYDGVVSLFGAIIASMIYFVFIGLTATVYAVRKERGTTRAVLAICGLANVVIFGFLSSQFLQNPGVWGLNTLTYTFVILSFVVGVAIYSASKRYHARRGVDISLAYKEIPPE